MLRCIGCSNVTCHIRRHMTHVHRDAPTFALSLQLFPMTLQQSHRALWGRMRWGLPIAVQVGITTVMATTIQSPESLISGPADICFNWNISLYWRNSPYEGCWQHVLKIIHSNRNTVSGKMCCCWILSHYSAMALRMAVLVWLTSLSNYWTPLSVMVSWCFL